MHGVPRSRVGQLLPGWRRHKTHVDDLKPEAGDPLHQPGEGSLIWEIGAKGGCAWTYRDLAVVKFRA